MSGDTRSVTTDALETLGRIIDVSQKRDAIHLAVEPIEAGEHLMPGENVGIQNGKAYGSSTVVIDNTIVEIKAIGIVDPFLRIPVNKGQRFWLVVYPRQITSLRHVWTHPDFPEPLEIPVDYVSALYAPDGTIHFGDTPGARKLKAESERWLRDWCDDADTPTYEDIIAALKNEEVPPRDSRGTMRGILYDRENGTITSFGSDASAAIPPEFWYHAEIVTGKKFGVDERAEYFSCSC